MERSQWGPLKEEVTKGGFKTLKHLRSKTSKMQFQQTDLESSLALLSQTLDAEIGMEPIPVLDLVLKGEGLDFH